MKEETSLQKYNSLNFISRTEVDCKCGRETGRRRQIEDYYIDPFFLAALYNIHIQDPT